MLILEKQTCVLLLDTVTVMCVLCDFYSPSVKWVATAAVYTHLWMPTLKHEEVIKWLHSLSHPHECHQEKTCGCPSRGFGRETFAPWPIPFSWCMIKKQHNNRLGVKSTIFHDCAVTSSKFLSTELINQTTQTNNIHLRWQRVWGRDRMTLKEHCIFI